MSAVALSSRGLERTTSVPENDFRFIGNACEITCTTFQAAFVSPRVHMLLQQDKTIDSLILESANQGIDWKRILNLFESLTNGVPIVPNLSDLSDLSDIAAFLGNTELLDLFQDDGPIESNSVCSRMRKSHANGRAMDAEITFAASHFEELDLEDLKALDVCLLERIVSSPSLRLEDENSLLAFVRTVQSGGPILLRYVRAEYLTSEGMSVFLDLLTPMNLDPLIWSSVCHRLIPPIQHEEAIGSAIADSPFVDSAAEVFEDRWSGPPLFELNQEKPFDGIISYLTTKYDGNVHENRVVNLTSSSVRSDYRFRLDSVVDLDSNSCFLSEDEPDQWVCWDFRERRVRPTHYTMIAPIVRSWDLEASEDGETWILIDHQVDNPDFDDSCLDDDEWFQTIWIPASYALSIPHWSAAAFRYIRLTQTDDRPNGDNVLALIAVEFFGTFEE
jgi:hypothetical protein